MESVFGIADGTDGHYHLQVPTYATENTYCLGEGIPTLVDGEFFFLKEALRTLLAVVHNLAGLSQTIDVVGAEGEDAHQTVVAVSLQRHGEAAHGVQNAHRIIHHAVGVHHGTEFFVGKPAPDIVGETRADKQHLLQWLYAECRLWYVYFCSEYHIIQ